MAESVRFGSTQPVERPDYLSWLKEASENRLIKAVTGFRRSGKSYLLKMLAEDLIEKRGIPKDNIFCLNFENDLLHGIRTVGDLRKIWDLYLTEIANLKKPIYIIWDEIQLVSGWERLVRTLYEMGEYNIFISGSNSQLLSGELSSSLSGRCLTLEVFPFSFNEYLKYLKVNTNDYYANYHEINQLFSKYLRRGGLPEQFKLDEDLAQNYKEGLIQKIILDDISKRYQIDKIRILQDTFHFISGNITSTLSLRKIAGKLAEQALNISTVTLENYVYYWETSFALSKLTKYDYKLSRIFDRTVKYYCVDNLFIPGSRESDEKRLENLVYNELTKRHGKKNVFFGSEANGYEIDFVIKKESEFLFFQVCLTLNDDNLKREAGNLNLINKYIKGNSVILTLNDERQKETEIPVESVIVWLLKT